MAAVELKGFLTFSMPHTSQPSQLSRKIEEKHHA
jgi:hypothetical protein